MDKWAIAYILGVLEEGTSGQMEQEEYLEGNDLLPDYPDEEYEPIASEFMFLVQDFTKQIEKYARTLIKEN